MAAIPDRLRLGPVIEAVDAHAAGEPGRVIVGGVDDVPGGVDVREDDLAPGEPRRRPRCACCASRAAIRPPTAISILPPTRPERRRRLRDHGAGRIPGHVGHQHDLRRHGAARDRHDADDRARHRADARGAGGADPRDAPTARDGKVTRRDVPERAGLRGAPRRARRGAAPRHGDGGRRLRRHVLRDRRRRAVRAAAHAGRGRRHRPDQRDDQGGGGRAAPRRPPGAARLRRDHDRAAVRARPRSRRTRPAQRGDRVDRDARLGAAGDVDGRDRSLAVRHRDLRADGGAPRQGPAGARRGRSATRASSARSSPVA